MLYLYSSIIEAPNQDLVVKVIVCVKQANMNFQSRHRLMDIDVCRAAVLKPGAYAVAC